MLDIDKLIPTHNLLRSHRTYKKFCRWLKRGKKDRIFLLEKKIKIIRLSPMNGVVLDVIHDGHHRLRALYNFGQRRLYSDEYVLEEQPSDYFEQINFSVGWVTPYTVQSECRLSDFFSFKETALNIANLFGQNEAEKFIRKYKRLYAVPREVHHIGQLVFRSGK